MTTEQLEACIANDDAVLDYTLKMRKFVLDKMLADGKLPEDPAEKKIILNALDGMDKAAIAKKRIKLEEKVVDSHAGAAAIIASILSMSSSVNAFKDINPVNRVAPTLGSDVPEPVLVEGEASVTANQQTFSEFMIKTTKIVD